MTSVIKKIEKNMEKGEEALKEVAEEIEEEIEKGKKFVKEAAEKLEEKVESKFKNHSKSKDESKEKKLEEEAEAESTTGEKDIEKKETRPGVVELKKILLEKAKKFQKKIAEEEISSEELKEKVKIKKKEMLIPLDEYVKAGIYLGTRVVTPNMRQFVYRRRADGLAIFNTDLIDEKIKEGIDFLSKFAPEDVILVCKREAGWKAAKKFSEITGIRVFTKKYPAGILTNNKLPDFFENELTIITDQWVDKNALNDTLRVRKKVLMVCDTNNFSKGADQIILGNNKSPKSLGLIFYLLATGYCKNRKISAKIPELEWWTGEDETSESKSGVFRLGHSEDKTQDIIAEAGIMRPEEGYGI